MTIHDKHSKTGDPAVGSTRLVGRDVPFKCEACGLEGHVTDPKPVESVSCPDCNARYLHYPDGKWTCVVRPIFAPNK
jgi:hypothetical protein